MTEPKGPVNPTTGHLDPTGHGELAPVYVLLACDDGSYVSGARIAVTGGKPILRCVDL